MGEKIEKANMRSNHNPQIATLLGSTILSTLLDVV
jgi:hypothetical protein